MNIYIYNCPNTYNYGSMMMGENFISYFNEISGGKNKFYIETMDEKSINRLVEATGVEEIYPIPMEHIFKEGTKRHDFLLAYLKMKNIISTSIPTIDLIIVLGGDDFADDHGWKKFLLIILNGIKFNLLEKAGFRVIMLGQTMGPYRSFKKHIMKKLLGKITKIYSRDPITFSCLNELGLININDIDDLALLPLAKQQKKERTAKYIMLCPSELIYRHSREGKREDWLDFNLFMIDKVMEKYREQKLVLLAHVLKPAHVDDRLLVNELYGLVKDKYEDRVICEDRELYPYQVRNYIQQALFTISSRMHPVISSIQCEIPAIALSYSTKYWGIIGERYGLGEYILDVRYLNYKEMKGKFIHLIEKIELEYEDIKRRMSEKNKLAEESIIKALEEITTLRGAK